MRRPPRLSLKLSPTSPPLEPPCADSFTAHGVTISSRGVVTRTATAAGAPADTHPPPPPLRALQTFAYDELVLERELGVGASARVYLARHRLSGARYALKCFALHDASAREQLLTELSALYAADCECIVGFHGATYYDGTVGVLLDFFDMTGLDRVLQQRRRLPEGALAGVAFQALYALAYLAHERRLHRDVKPANLLVASDGRVALTDLGISKQMQGSILARTWVGTCRYMAPERITHDVYDDRSDVWSLGLVLLEAATGRYPYADSAGGGAGGSANDDDVPGGPAHAPGPASHVELVMALTESAPPIPPVSAACSSAFVAFLTAALAREPAERASAAELLMMPWFEVQGVGDLPCARARVRDWLASTGLAAAAAADGPDAADSDAAAHLGADSGLEPGPGCPAVLPQQAPARSQ